MQSINSNITIHIVNDEKQKMELLKNLPDSSIAFISNILILKHNNDYYVVKIRPNYEFELFNNNAIIDIGKFNYVKLDDIPHPFDCQKEFNSFCKDKLVGKFNIIDCTAYRFKGGIKT